MTTALLFALLAAAPPGLAKPAPRSAAGEQGTARLLPRIEGWTLAGAPARYTPETLFEYIDGGAEAFFQFDFEDLVAASYANARKAEVTVDIYHHRDAARAFGIYSQERPPGSAELPGGIEGNSGSDHLEFVAGAYYVKLAQQGGSDTGKDASLLVRFADAIAAKIPGARDLPPVLACFPGKGKRPRAEKLTARDFLGHAFLHDAAAVPYTIDGAHFRLFAVEGKDASDVRAMVAAYRVLAKAPAAEIRAEGGETLKDPLNGEVTLQWSGRWLWGAVDNASPHRKALVEELGRNLRPHHSNGRRIPSQDTP
jgi:hypothetical protein